MKKTLVFLAFLLLLVLTLILVVLPRQIDQRANRVLASSYAAVSARAAALHQKLLIADLHCDALLWNRDLLQNNSRGAVDVPRLITGNVALQAFTIVSKVPLGLNIERNTDQKDMITLLALSQRWPASTWGSLKQRALYQAAKLHEFAARSNGRLVLIKTQEDLLNYLARRQNESHVTAGILGCEGAQVLEGHLDNLDVLFDAGIRMMAPTHFFDTEIGGSAHGVEKAGLTELGRQWVQKMEEKKMIIDLAHASPKVIDEVLALATRPLVVSHSGVKGTCDNTRNLSDDHVKRIAQTGGVIGIGFWETAVCGTDAKAIAQAIRYTANLAGVEHVGLGSDFDGAVQTPFDAANIIQLTEALLSEGFSEGEIMMIMGENTLRVLQKLLPN
ncbi:MAG: dipeptidase [candidate division KSB1 bacterium]|nr:dipeptidase [candidate division KSB1 bacterium]MDZ7366926.1 dipeptidase [candidate division KSB1 bacterium]MDZ7406095.1 dipeptidase [candidate division KSB1 bacterium]